MQKLYSSLQACEQFTERQNNEAHNDISKILIAIIKKHQKKFTSILNLSGRGNPQFFTEIGQSLEHFTWLTPSKHLEQIAKRNKPKNLDLSFQTDDIMDYLRSQNDNSIEIGFMKHTFAEIDNLEDFFQLLKSKLKVGGKFIANISDRSNLKPYSRNAAYFIGNQQIEEDEELNDGDQYKVKFFAQYNSPENGYIKDGELDFYYHSYETIRTKVKASQLDLIHLGAHQDITTEHHKVNSDILIVTKTQ